MIDRELGIKFKHNTKEIYILDSIMSSGKTTGIIKFMNENMNRKYLYVSPLLSEVTDRIPNECPLLDFVTPTTDNHKTKADHLLELLKDGRNISFTHSLFTGISLKHLKEIDDHNYTLIVDEEIDFIEQYNGKDYNYKDIVTLENSGLITVDENNPGRIKWNWSEDKFDSESVYGKLKRMCDLEMLHTTKRERNMLVLHLPISLVTVTEQTIVMTYLFKGSIMDRFMEMKGIAVKDFDGVQLIRTEAEVKRNIDSKVEEIITRSSAKVLNNPKKYKLSSLWYKDPRSKECLKDVGNAILSLCRQSEGKDKVLYTLPKALVTSNSSKKPLIRVRGFGSDECFLYCGTKATNLYSDRNFMIHAYNRYPMQSVAAYLQDYGFPINADDFALSEMIQWIFRSAIRNNESIKVAFLSSRMRDLWRAWLDGEM